MNRVTKMQSIREEKLGKLPVDKGERLWFNYRSPYDKDVDGNLAPFESSREPAVGVSRCGRFGQSAS